MDDTVTIFLLLCITLVVYTRFMERLTRIDRAVRAATTSLADPDATDCQTWTDTQPIDRLYRACKTASRTIVTGNQVVLCDPQAKRLCIKGITPPLPPPESRH